MSLATLTVAPKQVYGQTLYYPADDAARLLAAVLGHKTIPAYALHALDGKLVNVVQVSDAPTFNQAKG